MCYVTASPYAGVNLHRSETVRDRVSPKKKILTRHNHLPEGNPRLSSRVNGKRETRRDQLTSSNGQTSPDDGVKILSRSIIVNYTTGSFNTAV